ncbi:MAG: hypothetical protein K0S35_399 [Geminicoccaceae bacterium]|jgi:hypothetical protein|nr:hypothetical protein [Geminicoccaceae bacterium]
MKQLVNHLSYSRVVSTLALFLALAGGAYAISLGKNDVKSRHIAKGAVKSSDVASKALKGADVKPDSLKGSRIVESTLDTSQFTAAASTPFDPAGPIRCDPELDSGPPFVPCGEVSLTTPVAGRMLVIASGELLAEGGLAGGYCRLYLDRTEIGSLAERARNSDGFAVSAVSAPVPAGVHIAELRCIESSGEVRAEVNSVTAVLVGG